MADQTGTPGKKGRGRKPKDIADSVLDAADVAEGRKDPDEALEPAIEADDLEKAMVTEFDAGTQPSRFRRIRWLQGTRKGRCSNVGYKLASVQVALKRAEYVGEEE